MHFIECLILHMLVKAKSLWKKYRNIYVARLQFYRFLCYTLASDPKQLPLGTPARFPNLPLRLGFVPEPSGRRAFVWQLASELPFLKIATKVVQPFKKSIGRVE